MIFANNKKYVGSFKNGKPHGKGKMKWRTKDKRIKEFHGKFSNGRTVLCGGKYYFEDGTMY